MLLSLSCTRISHFITSLHEYSSKPFIENSQQAINQDLYDGLSWIFTIVFVRVKTLFDTTAAGETFELMIYILQDSVYCMISIEYL